MPQEEQEDFQMMLTNTYGGIGAIIFKPDVNGNVLINEPYEGSPAAKAGIRCGDEVVAIDGVSTHGLTSAESSDRMRGKPGTTVVLTIKKLRGDEFYVRANRDVLSLFHLGESPVFYIGGCGDPHPFIFDPLQV